MLWGEFFSLACAIGWAGAVVLFRHSSENLPASSINLFKNTLGFALMIPTVWIAGESLIGFTGNEYLTIAISGFIGISIADTLYLEALKRLGAGTTAIIGSLYSPFVIIGSLLFLNESLTALQWSGFAVVMMGVLVVSWENNHQVSKKHSIQGMLIGATAIVLMAAAILMIKPILETKPFFATTALRTGFALLAMIIMFGFQGKLHKIPSHFKGYKHWHSLIWASFLGTYLSMMFWLAGYKLTSASIASILNESASIFIILLARIFLKEALTRKKMIGVFCTSLGVVLVVLG